MSFASSFPMSSSPASSSSSSMSSPPPTPILPSTPTMPQHSTPPDLHRRSRSRDFWSTIGGFVGHYGPKSISREEDDEMMEVDEEDRSISIVLPPQLPKCTLSAAFTCSETKQDIPPAFYPGQSIPTVLTFQLDRYSSLPSSLNPTLTMSLVGTLHVPNIPARTIICVSVSLSEGLALWSRDAAAAHARRPPREFTIDPRDGLPGGTYSLPLTVQVPSTPRLPPTFTVAGASFAVTYALTVVLTCDDPLRAGGRAVLAEAARPFEMMPETMPTRAPKYNPTSFWVRSEIQASGSAIGTAKGLVRRPNSRWTIEPSLPTTTFSPTSVIPFSLTLTPPPATSEVPQPELYQVLIRLALIRREQSSPTPIDFRDPTGHVGLVGEEEISSRWGWVESREQSSISISDLRLPVMVEEGWNHGFSTMLNVGPANTQQPDMETISVCSTFHVAITLAFLPSPLSLDKYIPDLPPAGVFSEPLPPSSPLALNLSSLKRIFPGTIRTLPLPVVIGSVSEPRGALHNIRWSDLHLQRNAAGGEEGRMINGEGLSCEDGWILPPPGYQEAIKTVPYEY